MDDPSAFSKQESIPVGCIPLACQPYVFWWLPVDVSTRGGGYTMGLGIFTTPGHTHPLIYPPLYIPIPDKSNCPKHTHPLLYIPIPPRHTFPWTCLWHLVVSLETYPSPTRGQTDTCENITFPQLRLRAVMLHNTFSWLKAPCIFLTKKPIGRLLLLYRAFSLLGQKPKQ